MIRQNTYPINVNTRVASSMRAALNSKYCMRAQLKVRNLVNGQANEQAINEQHFFYQEGQHRVISNKQKINSNAKPHLPEEIKITRTKHGKRWNTSSLEVELVKDVLEVRDGLGKVVDAMVLKLKKF